MKQELALHFLKFEIFACSGKLQLLIYSVLHASIMFICPVLSTKAKGAFSSPALKDKAQIPVSHEENYPASQIRSVPNTYSHFCESEGNRQIFISMKPGWLPTRSLWREPRLGVRVSERPPKSSLSDIWNLSKQVSTIDRSEKKRPSGVCQD